MKKTFKQKCAELERDGWGCVDYQPAAKKAVYTKGGAVKKVSGGGVMSAVKEDIAAGVVTIGNINNVVSINNSGYSQELIEIHEQHLRRGRLINQCNYIDNRRDRELELEKIYAVQLPIDVIQQDLIAKKQPSPKHWLTHVQEGRAHCEAGLPPDRDNRHYLRGYGKQYELEAKQSALCLH